MKGSSRIFKQRFSVTLRSIKRAKNMNTALLYKESELIDDKRQSERFSMEVSALIECLRPKRRRRLLLKTTNLSASGVYFNTLKPFPKGAEVKVEISLHEGLVSWSVITVTGRVMRSEPKGMSLSFNEDYDIRIKGASDYESKRENAHAGSRTF
jgi:hypothetical protein